MYLVTFFQIYGTGISILFVVFVEAVGVCWIYGVDRFSSDVEKMIGHKPNIFWRTCWNYITPVFLLVSFLDEMRVLHINNDKEFKLKMQFKLIDHLYCLTVDV